MGAGTTYDTGQVDAMIKEVDALERIMMTRSNKVWLVRLVHGCM